MMSMKVLGMDARARPYVGVRARQSLKTLSGLKFTVRKCETCHEVFCGQIPLFRNEVEPQVTAGHSLRRRTG